MDIADRLLKCADCKNEFVFTAGEQIFFNDRQFKNDPKRCKLCKAKRAGLGRTAGPDAVTALPFSRTETRAECSACGIDTTVPFKPTQGRPVLCRACFQLKQVPAAVAAVANLDSAAAQVAAAAAVLDETFGLKAATPVTPTSSAATMEMIAAVPTASEGMAAADALPASAEVSQA